MKQKLNIGCGTDIRSDYINIDACYLDGVDYILDITRDKLPNIITNNKFDSILMYDIIEHITPKQFEYIIPMYIKLLSHSGILEIKSPDIDLMFDYYKSNNKYWSKYNNIYPDIAHPISTALFATGTYESHGYNVFDLHKWCPDYVTVERIITKAGGNITKTYPMKRWPNRLYMICRRE